MMKNKIYTVLYMLAAVVALSSCEHKELCYEHYSTLHLSFDWRNAPDAPEEIGKNMMRVYLYSASNPSSYRLVDLPTTGGYITEVPPGEYNIMCFNVTETGIEKNVGSFVRQSLTTSITDMLEPLGMQYTNRSSVPLPSDVQDLDPRLEPETIWGSTSLNVTVAETGVTYHSLGEAGEQGRANGTLHNTEYEIVLYPEELTCIYTLEVRHVTNLRYVSLMSASLSGLAESINLSEGGPSDGDVIVPFAIYQQGDSTIVGKFSNFGTKFTTPNRVTLYIWMDNGKAYAFGTTDEELAKYDVTDQVKAAENPHRVTLIIDGLKLPDVTNDSPGFDPSVDDWGNAINIDIVV